MDESSILYIDNHLLVVNKPAGLLVQGDASGDEDLLSIAKQYLKEKFKKPGNVFLGLVHRLDRPVSGVIVFARTSKAASRLSIQFRNRTVKKGYVAMLEGALYGNATLVNYVWKDHRVVRVVDEDHHKGMRAQLSYQALAIEKKRTLVEVQLLTGRPHQIRVQLAYQGHPVVGDVKYGAQTRLEGRNIALHSYTLEVEHPTSKERVRWYADVPSSWQGRFSDHISALMG